MKEKFLKIYPHPWKLLATNIGHAAKVGSMAGAG